MANITVYEDHLKPGETRAAGDGPWCYYVSVNGHITKQGTGFHSREDALKDAEGGD